MSQSVSVTIKCDECNKQIKDDDGLTEIIVRERIAGAEIEDGDGNKTRTAPVAQPDVTLHFHDKCFNRQSALKAERIEKLAGRTQ